MTQRPLGACQITLGSRLPGASWAITGLPSYFCQVAPPSALNARHWVNSVRRLAGRGIQQHDRRMGAAPQAGGVVAVDHRAAGEHGAELVRVELHRPLPPVQHVAAGRVAPVHVAPVGAVRVVLVEQVIGAVVVDQAVGVVQPAAPRREVELRSQRLVVLLGGARRLGGDVHPPPGTPPPRTLPSASCPGVLRSRRIRRNRWRRRRRARYRTRAPRHRRRSPACVHVPGRCARAGSGRGDRG